MLLQKQGAWKQLLEEFIQIWVLGLVFFRVFAGGLCTEVGRQAAVRRDGGEPGAHEDEHNSPSSERGVTAQLLHGGKPVPELWHTKCFQQRSENARAAAQSSTESSLGALAATVSAHGGSNSGWSR